jgi:hypothetical protein
MNKVGKATTIFLLVLAILSLCLTAGTLVLFRQEKDKRVSVEKQLEQLSNAKLQVEKTLEDMKKQSFLLEEKKKESDSKISSITSELDVEKSFREQLANENKALRDSLDKETKTRDDIKSKYSKAVGEVKALRGRLKSLSIDQIALEEKVKMISGGQVSLDKIVVNPLASNEGKVIVINKEHDFAVINMGEANGINIDQSLSVYRDKKYLGQIKIERVQNNLAVADFVPPLNKDKVREGDRVVIKK